LATFLFEAALLRAVLERLDFALELPELNVVTVDQLFGFCFRSVVIEDSKSNARMMWPSSPTTYARYSAISAVPQREHYTP
jgi:hypothetical protein